MILIAANSAYSFLGPDWEHADPIGPIELLQGDRVMRLSPKQIKTLPVPSRQECPGLDCTNLYSRACSRGRTL